MNPAVSLPEKAQPSQESSRDEIHHFAAWISWISKIHGPSQVKVQLDPSQVRYIQECPKPFLTACLHGPGDHQALGPLSPLGGRLSPMLRRRFTASRTFRRPCSRLAREGETRAMKPWTVVSTLRQLASCHHREWVYVFGGARKKQPHSIHVDRLNKYNLTIYP